MEIKKFRCLIESEYIKDGKQLLLKSEDGAFNFKEGDEVILSSRDGKRNLCSTIFMVIDVKENTNEVLVQGTNKLIEEGI